jgi:hypothetical protein
VSQTKIFAFVNLHYTKRREKICQLYNTLENAQMLEEKKYKSEQSEGDELFGCL